MSSPFAKIDHKPDMGEIIYSIPADDLTTIYKCLGCGSQIGRMYHVDHKIVCGCPRSYNVHGAVKIGVFSYDT